MNVIEGFFFFKQKTAYELRMSDWSSDVCSSDLAEGKRAKSSRPTCSSAMSSAPAKTMRKAVGSKIFPENSSKSATFSSTGKNRQKIAARRQKIAARLAAPAKARRKRGWKPLNEQQASKNRKRVV